MRVTTPRIAPNHNRKARLMDAVGVALLLVFSAAMGCIALILATPGAGK
jgi:hypothetical protein